MPRLCTVCTAPREQRERLESDLLEAASGLRPRSLAAVAQHHALSQHALRRHVRSGHSARPLPVALTRTDGDAPNLASVVGRLLDLADATRRVRLAAEQDGDRRGVLAASESEGRALGVLLLRLNITDTTTVQALTEAHTLARSIGDAARDDPAFAEVLARHLERRGAEDMAADVRKAIRG